MWGFLVLLFWGEISSFFILFLSLSFSRIFSFNFSDFFLLYLLRFGFLFPIRGIILPLLKVLQTSTYMGRYLQRGEVCSVLIVAVACGLWDSDTRRCYSRNFFYTLPNEWSMQAKDDGLTCDRRVDADHVCLY